MKLYTSSKKALAEHKDLFIAPQSESRDKDPTWHSKPSQQKSMADAVASLKEFRKQKTNIQRCIAMVAWTVPVTEHRQYVLVSIMLVLHSFCDLCVCETIRLLASVWQSTALIIPRCMPEKTSRRYVMMSLCVCMACDKRVCSMQIPYVLSRTVAKRLHVAKTYSDDLSSGLEDL